MTAAQQELAARYLPLARSLAKPFKRTWPKERDEFESAVCLALVEAAQSYDPSMNVKFATFARHRILGALADTRRELIASGWVRDTEGASRVVSLKPAHEMVGRVVNIQPEEPVADRVEQADSVEYWLRQLPRPHAQACRESFLNYPTVARAAEVLGYSRSRVGYLRKEAIRLLGNVPTPAPDEAATQDSGETPDAGPSRCEGGPAPDPDPDRHRMRNRMQTRRRHRLRDST
jgi:RNA polymerase sigma factor (sigma-70 family)